MGGWLKQSREDEETIHPGTEALARMPASVRGPEGNRFTPIGSDMPDDSDGDIALIGALLDEVAREQAPALPTPNGRFAENSPNARAATEHDLDLFRAMKSDTDISMRHDFRVPLVEMHDLLEELATTAAALRARKAA